MTRDDLYKQAAPGQRSNFRDVANACMSFNIQQVGVHVDENGYPLPVPRQNPT